jgi:hypothetical protein
MTGDEADMVAAMGFRVFASRQAVPAAESGAARVMMEGRTV